MLTLITPNSGIQNNQGFIKSSPLHTQTYSYSPPMGAASTGTFNDRENYYRGSLNFGSGVFITTTPLVLYDAAQAGSGLLDNLLIINRGNLNLYYGINSTSMNIANGTAVASGESVMIDGPDIRSVWAVTQSGTTVLTGQGKYKYNQNMI